MKGMLRLSFLCPADIFPSRHEVEIQECRQQLKQALAEEKEIADEIERAKRVLQLERGASARRERELEEMRAAHAREVVCLHPPPHPSGHC